MSEGGTGVSRWKLKSPWRRISEAEDVSDSRRLEKSDMNTGLEEDGGRKTKRQIREVDARESLTHSASKDVKDGVATCETWTAVLCMKAIPPPVPVGRGRWINE
jgi:hypothetical protein